MRRPAQSPLIVLYPQTKERLAGEKPFYSSGSEKLKADMGNAVAFSHERLMSRDEFRNSHPLLAPIRHGLSKDGNQKPLLSRLFPPKLTRENGFVGFSLFPGAPLAIKITSDHRWRVQADSANDLLFVNWHRSDRDSLKVGVQFLLLWIQELGYMPSEKPPEAFKADLARLNRARPVSDQLNEFGEWKGQAQSSFTKTVARFSGTQSMDDYGLAAAAAGLVFYCALDEGLTELKNSFSMTLVSQFAKSWAKHLDPENAHSDFGQKLVTEVNGLHAHLFSLLSQELVKN